MIKFISLIILFIFLVVFVTQTSTIKFTSPIGKNALQNTNTKIITNSNLTEFMKPSVNPISDMYYRVGNVVINPKTWIIGYSRVDIVNGAVSPNPPETGLQSIGFGIKEYIINPLLESKSNE
ncbi:hypothetical protein [Campylobacter concisus]|jgi:hypothetical protein|uniref:Uncharacterized protein n=2 Tax=Campylobacter concisus TaxID=199 RepID=A7ZBH0_CAMC1|nr:hypothetical protein [Campylobacter concisus]EAT97919.2 hypothetical protein CCC13826_2222 [Campylobacter concisus 13826]VTY00153.1 Uncharacterised protein [Campylobacter concisus]